MSDTYHVTITADGDRKVLDCDFEVGIFSFAYIEGDSVCALPGVLMAGMKAEGQTIATAVEGTYNDLLHIKNNNPKLWSYIEKRIARSEQQ